MREVARKADVSIKTVSRVVNEQGEISEDTRQRVLAVINELGYRPNMIARGLVTQRTYTVGLVFPDITNPFFPEVARGVQDVARTRDYNIFLCNSDENPQEELRTLHSLAAQGVDGIIIFPCYETGNNLTNFAEQYRPIVAVNHLVEHANIGMVLTENYQGSKLAVDYLVSKGHRELAMLAGLEISPQRAQRVHGFLDGLAVHSLPVLEQRILPGLPTLERGYESTLQLLTQDSQVTAIVVND
jgi:LacI family transcriptional regulator